MRIRAHSGDYRINLLLPTNLIFSDLMATLGGIVGTKYAGVAMDHVSPQQLRKLFRELRKIKRKYGSWELVDIQSSEGDIVKVVL